MTAVTEDAHAFCQAYPVGFKFSLGKRERQRERQWVSKREVQ
jgi:hypothetical protein